MVVVMVVVDHNKKPAGFCWWWWLFLASTCRCWMMHESSMRFGRAHFG